jgi:very-short-patch-repair endonuclease
MAKQHLTTYARNLRRNQTDAEKLLWKHLRTHRFSGIKFHQGYTVLRFWNNEIFTNIDAVLMTIEQSINRPSPPIKGGEE